MAREMLINVAESEECRVAIVEDGLLEELYVERTSLSSHVGNIYKGRVVNIESGIQAAFIDCGIGKNGFLHISDLHPRYFAGADSDFTESVGRRKSLKERLPIQNCLHKGKELVVQVTKEGMNTKGPTLSTYLALPGKFLVMMPWMRKLGISHKIEDDNERIRLRQILDESRPPKGMGFIIRTAGEGCSRRDIQNDLRYLKRLWAAIEKRIETEKAPSGLYQESDLVTRTLRDVFNSKIDRIVCDSENVVRKIRDFLLIVTPPRRARRAGAPSQQGVSGTAGRVTYYDSKVPLFHKYRIEDEIARIHCRTVALKGGGSIVLEQTEALVSIDINSGRYRKGQSAEQTAYKTNMEAVPEIARQLRLRDLGGLIICDFIDMRSQRHRRDVEKTFRRAVRADRARSRILRISRFGVVEMTRQRMRPSLRATTYLACPHCGGVGFIKSDESLAIEIIRELNLSASKEAIKRIELFVSPEVGGYLQNEKRTAIAQIEQFSSKRVLIHAEPDYTGEKHSLVCYNERGSVVKL